MLREFMTLLEWQGPLKATAVTALEAWGRGNAGNDPGAATLFPEGVCGRSTLTTLPAPVTGDDDPDDPDHRPALRRLAPHGTIPVPVMHLHGGPEERGHAHGTLLAGQLQVLRSLYLDRVFPTAAERAAAVRLGRRMLEHAPSGTAAEIEALGRASGVGSDDAALMQSFLDVMRGVACSTLAVQSLGSRDGTPMLGRNLDFPGFGIAHRYNLLQVVHADRPGRRSWAAFTWPGLMGPLTGMNEDGLTLATMQVLTPAPRFDGMPYLLLYREVLSQARTVPEAETMLRSARVASTNNLMLMDAEGRAAVVELDPEGVQVRRPRDGGLFSTNHFRAGGHKMGVTCRRYEGLQRRWDKHCGRFTPARMRKALHAVNQGFMTLQSMVLFPSQRRAEFAFGAPPTTAQPYVSVDIGSLFAAGRPPVAGNGPLSLPLLPPQAAAGTLPAPMKAPTPTTTVGGTTGVVVLPQPASGSRASQGELVPA